MHVHEALNFIGVSPFHEKIVSYELGVSLKVLSYIIKFCFGMNEMNE